MMYLPTEQELKDMAEVDKWLIFKDGHFCLRDDAPEEIRRKREELAKKLWSF
ncbi:hypothetical protein UYO_3141 [Lachnospiraceae bacterium JC7]|nr:hypothetical protein UYO_3141 [Lachnospiraceae bacterium JC7]